MFIGVGRITLDFYNNDNLALKHRKLDELCTTLRKKFNLSAMEVAEFEEFEKCILGFSAILPENWKEAQAKEFVQTVCKAIDETSFARVVNEDWDVLCYGPE